MIQKKLPDKEIKNSNSNSLNGGKLNRFPRVVSWTASEQMAFGSAPRAVPEKGLHLSPEP